MLEFHNATITNGDFRLSADWSLPEGATLAVIGPSGSGKSTLLNGVAGFLPCTDGAITWQGTPLPDAPDKRPVAMLFQAHNLFPHLSVAQNVGLGIDPSLKLSSQTRAQIEDALSDVGLTGMGARKPAQLSGGQQSRAALARVLVQARPLILLDEPFAALGPALRREMLALVQDLAARLEATLLMITHDPLDARALGGMVSFVDNNRAAAPVEATRFFTDPPPEAQEYLG